MVKISIALLTSSMNEFVKAKQLFRRNVNRFTHLSVIFRNDFAQDGLTRENRHAESLQGGFDILEPMCVRKYNENDNWYNYDLNAWVGQRKVRPAHSDSDFVPGPLNAKNLYDLRNEKKPIVPLDSVGGTMLYVRAEVHRQGVLFPAHYVIGSEWGMEGYDGIETEGLCYSAHFLGFKCWGMPSDIIFHAI
ncbi:hypothetical protein BBO99_00007727 [Phytophthora kernoviae]|uniref:Uncharacterized protein n=2 Tax=Phytophthora kernoviae TaxID=325452 RepID=A0A3R7FX24_9STRA|nr:hypothetical protein G195_008825 [Phytophthora kernoviae 00238/432]KAG2518174.1 hypothetical protein JM16_007392 [Phytophthora kernoviae]KAG2519970.1 hypothetical protein JM18_007370 [Phytophthora kernoviae]RLN05753.1 hypothetical protein BBI17_007658 [Phytophthora kernoviae]RLN76221.1 hypothetical protein BBO99_00007727 [Phytophthora kernoviae]